MFIPNNNTINIYVGNWGVASLSSGHWLTRPISNVRELETIHGTQLTD